MVIPNTVGRSMWHLCFTGSSGQDCVKAWLGAGGDQPEKTPDSRGDGAATGVNPLPTTEKPLDDVWGLFYFSFSMGLTT